MLHVLALWLLLLMWRFPEPEPPETFLVIEIGRPALAEETTQAPTADAPAPTAPTPRVADVTVGEPQRSEAPAPEAVAPEVATETAQPEPSEAAPAAPEPVTVETPRPPVPELAAPAPLAPSVQEAPVQATPLPEVTLPDVEPLRLEARVPVPMPSVAALLPEPRNIAPTPQVQVAAPSEVPTPEVAVAVAEAAPVPIPTPSVSVASGRPVPTPDLQIDVATSRDVSVTPQLQVAAPRPVPVPLVQAVVVVPVAPSTAAPLVAEGAEAASSEQPSQIERTAEAGGDAPTPAQSGPEQEPVAGAAGLAASPDGRAAATGSPATPAAAPPIVLQRPMAVMIDNHGGTPIRGLLQARVIVETPVEEGISRLMLLFDREDPGVVGPIRSARDYHVELAWRTRAVLVHVGGSPAALERIQASNALPTVDSFRPGAVTFERLAPFAAPYNTFIREVSSLRAAVNGFNIGEAREVRGAIYRPPVDAREVFEVEVRFGGGYRSAFVYQPTLNQYRWVRDGVEMVDANGEAVLVQALLVGALDAREIAGDREGRLQVSLAGGPATLYLSGQALQGRWELRDGVGVGFVDQAGASIDLTLYKTWVALTPTYAGVAEREVR